MVCMTQHLESAATCCVGLQVMMTPWSITLAFAGFDVVDLTVTSVSDAARTNAVVFGASLC